MKKQNTEGNTSLWISRGVNIGKKPCLTTYQGGGRGGEYEKMKISVVQHPEISILVSCNRFF